MRQAVERWRGAYRDWQEHENYLFIANSLEKELEKQRKRHGAVFHVLTCLMQISKNDIIWLRMHLAVWRKNAFGHIGTGHSPPGVKPSAAVRRATPRTPNEDASGNKDSGSEWTKKGKATPRMLRLALSRPPRSLDHGFNYVAHHLAHTEPALRLAPSPDEIQEVSLEEAGDLEIRERVPRFGRDEGVASVTQEAVREALASSLRESRRSATEEGEDGLPLSGGREGGCGGSCVARVRGCGGEAGGCEAGEDGCAVS